MQVTKKIIAPLIIMILLAGAAGIMSAREAMINHTQKMQRAGSETEAPDDNSEGSRQTQDDTELKKSDMLKTPQ